MDPEVAVAIDQAVAQEEYKQNEELWIAVRVTDTGAVAFMGLFTTEKAAKDRCQRNYSKETLAWRARGRSAESETRWLTWGIADKIKFAIAPRFLRDE